MPAINSIRFVELARLIGAVGLRGRAMMTPSLMLMIGVGTGFPSSAQSSQPDLSHQEIGAPPQKFEFWRAGRVDLGHWAVVRKGASVRLSLLLAFAICALIADNGGVAADADAGKNKAEACVACHGENGISQTENTPSLASLPDQFLQWQLVFFRTGARKNETMAPIAEQLSNEDVRDLAAYFASLKPPDPSAAKASDDHPELTGAGKKAAADGRCASCHGDNHAGTKAVARIAGQREEYLVKALHDYKSGLRSGGGVAAMAEVAYPLSEEEISALAHYLSRL